MNKLYYTWKQFEKDCEKLANQIKKDKIDYEIMVAITRGGLFVAGLLSQFLKPCVIETVCINSYKGEKRKELKVLKGNKSYKSVLICDDVVDTGSTLIEAKKLYPNSKSIVLHYKSKNKSLIKPDYFVQDTDKWIVYPWEVNEK